MVVGQADRIDLPAGQPDRHVPPERLLDVDPGALVPTGLLDELHWRRVLSPGLGDGQRPGQVEVEQGSALALVLTGQEVAQAVAVAADQQLGR